MSDEEKIMEKNKELEEKMKVSFDRFTKKVLSLKSVVANLLMGSAEEYKDCSFAEVMSCLDTNPKVGEEPVDDSFIMMDNSGGETVSVNDGLRSFDTKFKVKLPQSYKEKHKQDERVSVMVNMESQKSSNVGYSMEARGIYYLSRLISSQFNVEFSKSEFSKILKAYSYWICMNVPDNEANTITRYSFKPEHLVGDHPDYPHKYDLMTLVMIKIGKNKSDEKITGLLYSLFKEIPLNGLNQETKEKLEKDYGIKFTEEFIEEADGMCVLSKEILDMGMEKGMEKGRKEGREEGMEKGREKGAIERALNIAEKLRKIGMPEDKIAEIVGIDKETLEGAMNNK